MSSFDLHCHTTASDGSLEPRELLDRAIANGVSTLAITDHDTINGYLDIADFAKTQDIDLIPAIEWSCTWSKMNIHIVGLNLDVDTPTLQQGLERQRQARTQRADKIDERLQQRGLPSMLSAAQEQASGGQIGRVHFAKAMVDQGLVKDMNQAFKRYLGAGKPGDVKSMWPTLAEVVEWTNVAGGIAVIAHPNKYNLTRSKLRRLITDFKEVGGRGMEAVSGNERSLDIAYLGKLCNEFGLLASCGSDFHSPKQAWLDLGKIPDMPEGVTPVWHGWSR